VRSFPATRASGNASKSIRIADSATPPVGCRTMTWMAPRSLRV
jgi:hypothetical protein